MDSIRALIMPPMSTLIQPIADSRHAARLAPLAMAIVVMTLLAYVPAMRGGFIWDDDDYLTGNPHLKNITGLLKLWEPGTTKQYYPMVFTTFWIEHYAWGLDPLGYHVVNVLLHAVNAVLVWRLAVQLRVPGAWMVGMVFALHPVHVESVAWITERKNVLSGCFYLLAVLAFRRFDQPRLINGKSPSSIRWYIFSLVCFIAALLSKSVTCSLPAALILMMLYERRRLTSRRLLALAPMFVIGLALALHTAALERTNVGASGANFDFTPADRMLIASKALLFYPSKIFAPWPLMFIYPRWTLDTGSLGAWWSLAVVMGVCGAAAISFYRGWRGPLLALMFYAGTIFPALGFFNVYPMRFSFVADHFQYLASLGVIALVVALAASAVVNSRLRIMLGTGVIFGLGLLTWQRGWVYQNEGTLWLVTVHQNPNAWIAHNNLGKILQDRGEVAAALDHIETASKLLPGDPLVQMNLASVLRFAAKEAQRRGEMDEAERLYRRSLATSDVDPDAYILLGNLLLQTGRAAEAATCLQRFVQFRPDDAFARMVLGDALAASGRLEEALRETITAQNLAETQGRSEMRELIAQRLDDYRHRLAPVR
jgi:protein O-mannosyl-transferase